MSSPVSSIFLNHNTSAVVPYYPRANYTLVKDVRDWLFNRKKYNDTPNMTVLPVLALICFIVCVMLTVYKWYKDNARMKARGDLEFGDESEVNYGIIKAGDKEYCNVEIRSDTTSVYDTVNSFRNIGNGHAIGGVVPHNCHDTVTSYKSLLMQRLDGAQYDSVKSYKAFIKQVTQNSDLAVEVKLLENYPMRSKSAEHCVLEEESSGISEAIKPFTVADIKIHAEDKKKTRHRRASGDVLGAMRKRSASNPTYDRGRNGAASLPSIHNKLSSDSSNEDETFVTLPSDRRKLWETRKKMARSCSGGRLAKDSLSPGEERLHETPQPYSRRRHYSAESARHPRKNLVALCHRAELKDLRESISETDPRTADESYLLLKRQEDSSSENPDSSPTSCNTSVSSDAIESESEDEDTQQITQVSVASDDHTMSCEGVFDSSGDLNSSTEHLLDPVKYLSEPVNDNSNLQQKIVKKNEEGNTPASPVTSLPSSISKSIAHHNGSNHSQVTSALGANNNECNFSSLATSEVSIIQTNTQSSPTNIVNNGNSILSDSHKIISNSVTSVEEHSSYATESPDLANPRRVKRFHVTFVSSDVSSPNSD